MGQNVHRKENMKDKILTRKKELEKQASLFGETFDEEFADECEGLCGV